MVMVRLFSWFAFILSMAAALFFPGCHCTDQLPPASRNATKLREALSSLDVCLIQSSFSYTLGGDYAPTSIEHLSKACEIQAEGFKCTKERVKPLEPVLRRGVQIFLKVRQKHHKKYCTNVSSSEVSRQLVRANKCMVEKRRHLYEINDSKYGNTVTAIARKNFNDAALELKYICCAFYEYRKSLYENIGPQCESHRTTVEEMLKSQLPNEIGFICDEDEDGILLKVCPKLEPLKVSKDKFVVTPGKSPLVQTMQLIVTLGEPE